MSAVIKQKIERNCVMKSSKKQLRSFLLDEVENTLIKYFLSRGFELHPLSKYMGSQIYGVKSFFAIFAWRCYDSVWRDKSE